MGLINQSSQGYYNGNVFGNYQFTSLDNIINQFMVAYVGEEKTIPKARRVDVAFHAQRALQELSFDTLKSIKAQEITVPATLQMPLPQDYVNYTKISSVDSAGIKHLLYPTSKTSNPNNFNNYAQNNPIQNSDGDFKLQAIGDVQSGVVTGVVPLDAEYKDILVGMSVTGFNIPSNTFVNATSNSGGITTITLGDGAGNVVLPSAPYQNNNGITLTFTNTNNSVVKSQSIHIVENINWILGEDQVTGHTGYDFSNIKIGMIVSSEYFPVGTKVTNVYQDTISFDNNISVQAGIITDGSGELTFIDPDVDANTWANYKSTTPSENNNDDYEDDTYWPNEGQRYGLDPQHAQVNGSFYIDEISGKIHFSSNISGKTVILDYISDSLGSDGEMQVHKFAEEAMYKSIIYAILSMRANTPEYIVRRFKKERFAAIRNAKLRLSNIKLEEITQILRGKSKQIKH